MKQIVNITDVCSEIFAGGDAPKGKMSLEKNERYTIPIYSNGEANDGLYGYTDVPRVTEPSVTISARGTIGYTSIRNTPFVPIVRLITITPNQDLIDIKYLYYATQNYNFGGSGTSIPQLTIPSIKKYSFPLPDKEHQQYIVDVLDKVSGLIDLRKQQLSKFDELVKSRFIEMFGDPENNEKKWVVKTFGDICTVRQGLQIPIAKRLTHYEDDCYEYITVSYLHGSKDREYIKNPKSNVICTKDDVLMTRTGNTGMVITDVEGVFHNNFFLIDFDRTKYNKRFLVEYLNLDLIQAELIKRAGTSTIPDLNHGQFYAVSIYEPPVSLQNEFATFVEQTDKLKFEVKESLEKLETLKKSLMQKYFG